MSNRDRDIYFCGSIRGGREDAELYGRLIKTLKEHGAVLTEHVATASETDKDTSDDEIHDRNMKWLAQADVVVAEVTQPSLGVGYELGRAVSMGKRLLCLYRPEARSGKQLSAMIRGLHNDEDMIVTEYKEDQAADIFRDFFAMEDGDVDDDEDGDEDGDEDLDEDEGDEGDEDGGEEEEDGE